MASLATVSIKFLADLKGFSSQMQNANRKLAKTGRDLQRIGGQLSASVTLPLTLVGGAAVAAYSELEGVKNAFDRLNDATLLDNLRKATKGTVSDLELMKAAVKAENFNIPLEQLGTLLEFARRRAKDTGESVDFLVDSIVTGIGRKSPLILDNLGISASALRDELGGAAAASSSIGDITKAVGKIAGQELGKMGKDTTTFKESLQQVQATFTNILGELGGIIAEIIQPFVGKLGEMVKWFKELSPTTKKFIVILGGIAAAIGPLLALAGTILPAIGTGFAILTGPIGLVAAALVGIGAIIYKYWEPIKKTLIDIANYFIDLYNESTVFRIAVEAIGSAFKNIYTIAVFVFDAIGSVITLLIDNIKSGFKSVGKIIKGALTFDLDLIKEGLAEGFERGKDAISNFVSNIKGDFDKLKVGISDNINDAIKNIKERPKIDFIKDDVDASKVSEAVSDATADGVKKGLKRGFSGVVDTTPQVSTVDTEVEAEGPTGLLGVDIENPLASITADLPEQVAVIDESFLKVQQRLQNFRDAASEIGSAVGGTFQQLTGRIVESLGLASTGFEGFVGGLLTTVTKLISMMLAQSIAQSIAGATASGTATGPAAIFTTPAFIATAVGGVLAAFAAIPKFATGGIVGGSSTYGDKILARVNSGELILNQKQQKNLYGQLNSGTVSQTVIPDVRLKGEDLVLAFSRTNKRQARES